MVISLLVQAYVRIHSLSNLASLSFNSPFGRVPFFCQSLSPLIFFHCWDLKPVGYFRFFQFFFCTRAVGPIHSGRQIGFHLKSFQDGSSRESGEQSLLVVIDLRRMSYFPFIPSHKIVDQAEHRNPHSLLSSDGSPLPQPNLSAPAPIFIRTRLPFSPP